VRHVDAAALTETVQTRPRTAKPARLASFRDVRELLRLPARFADLERAAGDSLVLN
jgi:hypothetical protein